MLADPRALTATLRPWTTTASFRGGEVTACALTAASSRPSSSVASSAPSRAPASSRRIPPSAGQWPWATFIVNVVGAFLLGYFTTRLQERLPLSAYRRPLLGTGLCGALTTFSTMQVELLYMLDEARFALAASYAAASVAAGFLAVMVATNLVRRARVTG